jgi:hypothetical protein
MNQYKNKTTKKSNYRRTCVYSQVARSVMFERDAVEALKTFRRRVLKSNKCAKLLCRALKEGFLPGAVCSRLGEEQGSSIAESTKRVG